MPWFKVTDATPADGAEVLIHDGAGERIRAGRYIGGRWFVKDSGGGSPNEVEGVTHWAPLLDSEEYDPADD